MANVIKITKGLNINLKGKAAAQVSAAPASKVYGLVPDSFWGMKPKVVVKEGDEVTLPGMGVFLSLIWKGINEDIKKDLIDALYNELQKEKKLLPQK